MELRVGDPVIVRGIRNNAVRGIVIGRSDNKLVEVRLEGGVQDITLAIEAVERDEWTIFCNVILDSNDDRTTRVRDALEAVFQRGVSLELAAEVMSQAADIRVEKRELYLGRVILEIAHRRLDKSRSSEDLLMRQGRRLAEARNLFKDVKRQRASAPPSFLDININNWMAEND